MKYLNKENTLWSHENRSGSINDPYFKEWLAEGNTPELYVEPPKALQTLEPYQFFAALDLTGKRTALDAFIAALPAQEQIVAKAKLTHSKQFRPDNALVQAAKIGMGLTDAEFKAMWEIGESIE